MNFRPLTAPLLACVLAACTPKPQVDETAVFGAIRQNLKAMEREDLEALMTTVHPAAANTDAMRTVLAEVFAKYDLKYELRDLKVVGAKDDEVKVYFSQKTTRVGGDPDFSDNVVEGVHTLKKDGAEWKLLGTVNIRATSLPPQ